MAKDESSQETFLRPPVGHEARRQVVEQFGVGGAFAAFAEIVDAADEALAEELLPETIHRHAGRQRVTTIGDPFRELKAAALAGRYRGELVPGGDAQGAAGDDGGGGVGIAAHVDRHIGRFRVVLHGEGLGRLRFEEFRMLELVVLGLQEGGEFVAALGQGFLLRGWLRGRSGRDGLGLVGWNGGLGFGGFLKGGEFRADGFILFGQFGLLRFECHDLSGVFGFGFLALGQLGRCFRERDAADRAPDPDPFQLHGRGRTAQHAGHAVVVVDPDGIELVVVATGAAHRHAEESPADFDELGVDVVRLHLRLVGIDDFDVADHQETRGDELGGALFRGGGRHQVAGELFLDEMVKRFVLVEGLDEVIAIAPSVFGKDFIRGADHVGIAGEIEPVAGPALAVGR